MRIMYNRLQLLVGMAASTAFAAPEDLTLAAFSHIDPFTEYQTNVDPGAFEGGDMMHISVNYAVCERDNPSTLWMTLVQEDADPKHQCTG